MKKFKTFHYESPNTAVGWANEWLEENPDVEIVQVNHSLDKDDHDVILILYEERGTLVEMDRTFFDDVTSTMYQCPRCAHAVYYGGNIILHDPHCPKCKRGDKS